MKPLARFLSCLLLAALPRIGAADPGGAPDASAAPLCNLVRAECAAAQKLAADAADFLEKSKTCAAVPCDRKTIDSLNITCNELKDQYSFLITKTIKLLDLMPVLDLSKKNSERATEALDPIFSIYWDGKNLLKPASDKVIAAGLGGLEDRLNKIEFWTESLEAASLAKTRGLQSLRSQAAKLAEDWHGAALEFDAYSISIDHSSVYSTDDAQTLQKRARANVVAVCLSDARARLVALEKSLGLPLSSSLQFGERLRAAAAAGPHRPTQIGNNLDLSKITGFSEKAAGAPLPQDLGGPAVAAAPAGSYAANNAIINASPRRLRLEAMAPPAPGQAVAPYFASNGARADSLQALSGMTSSQKDLKRVEELRRKGETVVFGDPQGRAALVHAQQGPDCSIVAQQEILVAAGAIPAGDPVKTEQALVREAKARKFYDDGVPAAYSGDLLVAHGLLIVKRQNVSDAELERVVKAGAIALVSVDAAWLWNDPSNQGAHSIVVTGTEVSKKDGKVLGYYINDSAGFPVVGGRFVPAGQFLKAWHENGGELITPT